MECLARHWIQQIAIIALAPYIAIVCLFLCLSFWSINSWKKMMLLCTTNAHHSVYGFSTQFVNFKNELMNDEWINNTIGSYEWAYLTIQMDEHSDLNYNKLCWQTQSDCEKFKLRTKKTLAGSWWICSINPWWSHCTSK